MILESLRNAAAIVCSEVANGAPILYARRSKALEEADSGWQFLCGAGDEDVSLAQVWAIHEVVERDASISEFLGLPAGTVLTRSSPNDDWKVSIENQRKS